MEIRSIPHALTSVHQLYVFDQIDGQWYEIVPASYSPQTARFLSVLQVLSEANRAHTMGIVVSLVYTDRRDLVLPKLELSLMESLQVLPSKALTSIDRINWSQACRDGVCSSDTMWAVATPFLMQLAAASITSVPVVPIYFLVKGLYEGVARLTACQTRSDVQQTLVQIGKETSWNAS